ncbi:HTH_Tnp_Tc3_2 domain-containing protein [Trichonephila clavipes]|nr:HTH_Tnp_Tc3_2 domain-containing protein [Trichonephila clavipes]
MGRNDADIRTYCQEWCKVDNGRFQRHDGSGRPWVDQEDRLIVKSTVTVPDSSLSALRRATLFSDESCFHLCPDDHRRRVWRHPGQRADPAFPIACHTDPQPGVMVWYAIFFTAEPLWSSLEAHFQHSDTSTTF